MNQCSSLILSLSPSFVSKFEFMIHHIVCNETEIHKKNIANHLLALHIFFDDVDADEEEMLSNGVITFCFSFRFCFATLSYIYFYFINYHF